MVTVLDYKEAVPIAWCPGCGNFGILGAMRKALVDLNLEPHQILMVSGIGQAGKFPHYLKGNVLNELHGRALPAAQAAKICNPALTVLCMGGDGDGFGEGGNHFIAAMNRNVTMTYLVHDNQVYALTKGQASPTSDPGYVSRTSPEGSGPKLNPLALAIASDCSLVIRGFAGDIEHLSSMIKTAINHKGFAFIDILQPCVSFNHKNTFTWYKERVYKVSDDPNYNPEDRNMAFSKALEWEDRIPIGIIYRHVRPAFETGLLAHVTGPLVKQEIDPTKVKSLVQEYL